MILNAYKNGQVKVRLVGKPIEENFEIYSDNPLINAYIILSSSDEKKYIYKMEKERLLTEHEKILDEEDKEKSLKEDKVLNNIAEISVNIWDEVSSNGKTYIYVEEDLSEDTQESILGKIHNALIDSEFKQYVCGLRLKRSVEDYSCLLFLDSGVNTLYRRWELELKNLPKSFLDNEKILENIVVFLNDKNIDFKEKKISVFSES